MKLRFGLPLLSALLLWLSYPPANLWPLAWISLVPWMAYLAEETRLRRAVAISYAAGALFFLAGFGWLRFVSVVAPLAAGVVYGLHWALFAAAMRLPGPAVVKAPAAWILLEWLRGVAPVVALPWFYLGHTQIDFPGFAQAADLGGVLPLSAVMVAFQALASDAARAAWAAGRRPNLPPPWRRSALAWCAVLVALVAYGAVRSATLRTKPGPRLLVVQPNIPQDNKEIALKLSRGPEEIERWKRQIYDQHLRVTREGMRAAVGRIDLVVWPEAALLYPVVFEGERAAAPGNLTKLVAPAIEHGVPLLTGLVAYQEATADGDDRWDNFNSAVLVRPDGTIEERYDKIVLVPFGEYVPLGWLRGIVERVSGLGRFHDTTPGSGPRIMEIAGERFGAAVCFEGVLPGICRWNARKGARFVVNISNDGWFRDSAELDQVLAVVRFRSIENRIGFVRATNTGISALIGPDGAVQRELADPDGRVKEIEGALEGEVTVAESGSPYRAVGDWPALLLALAAAGFAAGRRPRV